jgi:eukaryotic-like serine/threonine-protein kinase
MPAPATADEFFAVVEKSRLLSASVLGDYRSSAVAEALPPDRVVDRMVRDGALTTFQAGLLMEGKSRPFFVGPYKVLSRIGNGSSGVVYLCEHVTMRRKVAVKVLQGRRAKDEVSLQRFLREARAAAALNHPNVVHALDLGREGDIHYLSMEYVDGGSLMALVRQEGPLAPRRLGGYLRQAAAGLAHAHAAGLVHRDITPSNVMVTRDGAVKLLDLGLALFADGDENLTQGAPIGVLGYIAPEQARNGHDVDARADIYSLGATISFGLTGRAPNPCRPAGETPAPKPRPGSNPDFEPLRAIVERMMALDPANRFQTADEVVEAVAKWLDVPVAPAAEPIPLPPAPAAPVADPAAETLSNSTDFTLGPDPSPPAAEQAKPAEEASSDFSFDLPPRAPKAPKWDKPPRSTFKSTSPLPAPSVTPPPRPAQAVPAAPAAPESWAARYSWVLIAAALAFGFGLSYLLLGKRETAADVIPRAPPRSVTPNSP